MRFVIDTDRSRFIERVMPFLEAEVERNLLATILLAMREGGWADPAPLLGYGLDAADEVVAVALRTPPFPLLCTGLPEPGAAEAVLDVWLDADPVLAALNAPRAAAVALVAAWERRTDGIARPQTATMLHALTEVTDPPRPAAGELRPAGEDQLELLIDWTTRFSDDVHARIVDPAATVRQRLAGGAMWLWHAADGRPVSMVGAAPPVAGVQRIVSVYTPREERGHGYAGSAVAAASRLLLARGARTCTLFTDLANPTSNKIYAEVGYRPVGEWQEYSLGER